jgi:phosphohistidine phosphatase
MKKVIFIRHGKAEIESPEFSDFERSLVPKGKNVSRLMAAKLKVKEKDPGTLITSPAFRAIETALIFSSEYGIPAEKIIICSDMYFRFNEKTFIKMLNLVTEDTDTITLFGHNPSFTELATFFCKEACDVIPKSGIVCLSFNIKTWSGIKPNTGDPSIVMKPKKVL